MFISKHTNGIYYVYYEIDGKRKSITTKQRTKSKALEFLKTFTPDTPPPQKSKFITWSEARQMIVESCRVDNYSRGTLEIYERTFRLFGEVVRTKAIQLITAEDVLRFKSLRAEQVSPVTVNIELRTLKSIFSKLRQFVEVNPMANIRQVRTEERPLKAFTGADVERVRQELSNDKVLRNIFEVAINTGARLNEILNLKYRNINLFERTLTIENSEHFRTKSRKNRIVPLNDRLVKVLSEYFLNPDQTLRMVEFEKFLFGANGHTPYNKSYISRRFTRHLKRIGLSNFHFHCLRHTFASSLVRSGVSAFHVQQILGHSDLKTTEKYLHCRIDDLREAVSFA